MSFYSSKRSGNISGNAGVMGNRTPYVVIKRNSSYTPSNLAQISGQPSNEYHKLSSCKGFTVVKDCHLENINATDEELSMIESLLKKGVIV